VGVVDGWPRRRGADGGRLAAAARRIERAGYRTLWLNESPAAREPFPCAALVLDATERLVLAIGIANIWVRDPVAALNAAVALAEAYPGRFALGLEERDRALQDARAVDGRRVGP
jgi:alkanesulfonate monooxygenase SsuD/methylene tetrahydromethanopterin reductase-like flavin-dependent oxidoreductase (luciferase family)